MIHDLKTHPGPFAAAKAGLKHFTIRCADKPFQVGDLVLKREWDPYAKAYTGEELEPVPITYVVSGYGLQEGHVVLGLGDRHAARRGAFLHELAESLGVSPAMDGVEEDALLRAVARLKARAGEDDRLGQVHLLMQEAHQYAFLGSAPRSKASAAEACRILSALIDGRA
jgi:hypothetical protein